MELKDTRLAIRIRRDTKEKWLEVDPVLALGEPGYEVDTNNIKVGNGSARWSDLDYLVPERDENLYNQLMTHVNNVVVHTVFDDDGPSLLLLYQNAKV